MRVMSTCWMGKVDRVRDDSSVHSGRISTEEMDYLQIHALTLVTLITALSLPPLIYEGGRERHRERETQRERERERERGEGEREV